jgi:DNA-binding IclR family transcriptional regulator
LDYIDNNASIANRDAQELLGLKDNAVRRVFSQMINAGLIEADGENRYRVYRRATE